MKAQRSDLVRMAQEFVNSAIEILEVACEGDANAQAYMIDQLKIHASSDHGFLSSNLNLDELAKRYEETEEDVQLYPEIEVDPDWYNRFDEML